MRMNLEDFNINITIIFLLDKIKKTILMMLYANSFYLIHFDISETLYEHFNNVSVIFNTNICV